MNKEVSEQLHNIATQLALFLERVLPLLYDDWWSKAVVRTLLFQQKMRMETDNISSLDGLTFDELLHVLDQNWYQIGKKMVFKAEARQILEEMQRIHNRYNHHEKNNVKLDEVYQDLDSIERFADVINADKEMIEKLRLAKTNLIPVEQRIPSEGATLQSFNSPYQETDNAEFELGQIVSVKSDPTIIGAVVSIQPGEPENRYKVLINGATQTFYKSQLRLKEEHEESDDVFPCDQFHAYLTALHINYPGLSTLYSLNAARVDFIPYQFRPVLRFIRSDRPRLLIADGVGVGKTIEAGLILRELQARRDLQSVLIVCPRPLVTERKWLNEMKRFEERFTHLDGATLRYCINEMDLDGVWPEQHRKSVVPYSLFDEALLHGSASDGKSRRNKGLLDLDPPPRFDLVIVDEAHHIRNRGTFSHKAVRFFCDHAEAVVFLTATPVQLGSNDLFVLLNTLRPDLIIDEESFSHMAEPNPFINQAVTAMRSLEPDWQLSAKEALDQASSTPWGQAILKHNPNFNRVRSELQEGHVSQKQRIQMISDTEELHSFAGIINRTRRRDIGNFTVRKPQTVIVPFTSAQEQLHDKLLSIQAEIFSQIHNGVNVKFMMTTISRQAASCLFGLVPFLEQILNRHLDELSWAESDDSAVPENESIIPIQDQIQNLLEAARSLESSDPKLDALRGVIRDKQNLPNNKIMLFSSFRHTLNYLFDHLSKDGFRVGLVHGGTPDEDRVSLRSRFEKPRKDPDCLDLLLFSEIGCEGLDFQFCDCIVNYDLPWNPMRVEQRIGRIDRRGQRSESVAIVNLITPGTVDADIYERCLMRIGVFNNAIGGSEEILGEITREIKNIAENYELSQEERKEMLQQLADNKVRLVQEQEELEQRQAELFGIHLPKEQLNREISEATSFWLSVASLQRLLIHYLQRRCGKDHEFFLGEKPLKTLRLAQEFRSLLLRDFQMLPRQNSTVYRNWENWLKGGSQHLVVTFESDCAMHHPEAAFIMPLHPLVKQAALSFDTGQRVTTNLEVSSHEVSAGRHKFAVYQWRFQGIREDMVLQPIASNPSVTESLGRLLENAKDNLNLMPDDIDDTFWYDLDTQHYNLWSEARNEHKQRTYEQVEYRRESLSTSHRARIALLQEQFNQATDKKIQKMRRSQIEAAELDYSRRIEQLDTALERADIVATQVATGLIHVIGGSPNAD